MNKKKSIVECNPSRCNSALIQSFYITTRLSILIDRYLYETLARPFARKFEMNETPQYQLHSIGMVPLLCTTSISLLWIYLYICFPFPIVVKADKTKSPYYLACILLQAAAHPRIWPISLTEICSLVMFVCVCKLCSVISLSFTGYCWWSYSSVCRNECTDSLFGIGGSTVDAAQF